MLIEFIKRASTGGSAGMSDADALALKAAIEAKGGTVTMDGDAPTVAELSAGIGTIIIVMPSTTETYNALSALAQTYTSSAAEI